MLDSEFDHLFVVLQLCTLRNCQLTATANSLGRRRRLPVLKYERCSSTTQAGGSCHSALLCFGLLSVGHPKSRCRSIWSTSASHGTALKRSKRNASRCPSSKPNPPEFPGAFNLLAITSPFMAPPTSGAVPAARSEIRTRTALVLEAIALRHQIAVLERSRTRRPVSSHPGNFCGGQPPNAPQTTIGQVAPTMTMSPSATASRS